MKASLEKFNPDIALLTFFLINAGSQQQSYNSKLVYDGIKGIKGFSLKAKRD